MSSRTDIGGMSENQDDCFIWHHEQSGSIVFGVLDGHGRDVGKLAAQTVKAFMQDWLSRRWEEVLADPAAGFRMMFTEANTSMKATFKAALQREGWTVREECGYLIKRRGLTSPWSCVHGGTSGSVIALVEGKTILIANVGDSSATLTVSDCRLERTDIVQRAFWAEGGGVFHDTPPETGTVGDPAVASDPVQTLILTADHSPESLREYGRMLLTHPHPQKPTVPHLSAVYDSSSKLKCLPVFENDASGQPFVTGRGRYYKNVRREWASLVATPFRARFQDALAFTRSIGDYHLQTYGVTHIPDVLSMELTPVFQRHQQHGEQPSHGMVACILACSDGIWDNWGWGEVGAFFLEQRRVEQVTSTGSSDAALEEFMSENARRAHANFGNQADNATAICCYILVSSPNSTLIDSAMSSANSSITNSTSTSASDMNCS